MKTNIIMKYFQNLYFWIKKWQADTRWWESHKQEQERRDWRMFSFRGDLEYYKNVLRYGSLDTFLTYLDKKNTGLTITIIIAVLTALAPFHWVTIIPSVMGILIFVNWWRERKEFQKHGVGSKVSSMINRDVRTTIRKVAKKNKINLRNKSCITASGYIFWEREDAVSEDVILIKDVCDLLFLCKSLYREHDLIYRICEERILVPFLKGDDITRWVSKELLDILGRMDAKTAGTFDKICKCLCYYFGPLDVKEGLKISDVFGSTEAIPCPCSSIQKYYGFNRDGIKQWRWDERYAFYNDTDNYEANRDDLKKLENLGLISLKEPSLLEIYGWIIPSNLCLVIALKTNRRKMLLVYNDGPEEKRLPIQIRLTEDGFCLLSLFERSSLWSDTYGDGEYLEKLHGYYKKEEGRTGIKTLMLNCSCE